MGVKAAPKPRARGAEGKKESTTKSTPSRHPSSTKRKTIFPSVLHEAAWKSGLRLASAVLGVSLLRCSALRASSAHPSKFAAAGAGGDEAFLMDREALYRTAWSATSFMDLKCLLHSLEFSILRTLYVETLGRMTRVLSYSCTASPRSPDEPRSGEATAALGEDEPSNGSLESPVSKLKCIAGGSGLPLHSPACMAARWEHQATQELLYSQLSSLRFLLEVEMTEREAAVAPHRLTGRAEAQKPSAKEKSDGAEAEEQLKWDRLAQLGPTALGEALIAGVLEKALLVHSPASLGSLQHSSTGAFSVGSAALAGKKAPAKRIGGRFGVKRPRPRRRAASVRSSVSSLLSSSDSDSASSLEDRERSASAASQTPLVSKNNPTCISEETLLCDLVLDKKASRSNSTDKRRKS